MIVAWLFHTKYLMEIGLVEGLLELSRLDFNPILKRRLRLDFILLFFVNLISKHTSVFGKILDAIS